MTSGSADVTERFSPGTYITLTDSEALNRPPFDVLPSGRVLSLADPALSESAIPDTREVLQIVISNGVVTDGVRRADGRSRRHGRPGHRRRKTAGAEQRDAARHRHAGGLDGDQHARHVRQRHRRAPVRPLQRGSRAGIGGCRGSSQSGGSLG